MRPIHSICVPSIALIISVKQRRQVQPSQTRVEARIFLKMGEEEKSTLIVSMHPTPTTSVVTTAREEGDR